MYPFTLFLITHVAIVTGKIRETCRLM